MEEATLQAIMEKLDAMQMQNTSMADRLLKLEDSGAGDERGGSSSGKNPPADLESVQHQGRNDTQVILHGSAREKALSLTFGEDESPMALRLFLEHYSLARDQNLRRGIDGWAEKPFRARELRYQLRGKVAAWVAQESAMLQPWVEDDEEIIKRLNQRYMGTQSIELNIIAFEELQQNEGESLADYMTRCQDKGYQAFADFDPRGIQQRIVWKFLSGIRDATIRQEVIREKWMETSSDAKPFADVLKIAETARMLRAATAATGKGRSNQPVIGNAAVSRVDERRKGYGGKNRDRGRTPHSSNESSSNSSSKNSSRSDLSNTIKEDGGNFLCHYCKERSHFGGWKNCEKRRKENPTWTPSSNF